MILIFDLDDTLYSEKSYAVSGFQAVAKYISFTYKVEMKSALHVLLEALENNNRSRAFQKLMESQSLPKKSIKEMIAVYRKHMPEIEIDVAANKVLEKYAHLPKYLVTDGNRIVQGNKIKALKLDMILKRCFITHAFGISASKPSTYCFQKIRELENVDWAELVYVGDDPKKDFVNLKPLGVTTVRVLTGRHAKTDVSEEFDAEFSISSIDNLDKVLELRYGH
jgi:putative hydrolase of the HAD superfamily